MLRTFPSPKLAPGLLNYALGHLVEMRNAAKKSGAGLSLGLYLMRREWYQRANSKTVSINVAGKRLLLTADPVVIKEVLGTKKDSFKVLDSIQKSVGFFFPTSVIAVEGEQWQRQRKVIQHSIGKQSMDPVVPIMCKLTDKLINDPATDSTPTLKLLNRVTFDAFHHVMYGMEMNSVSSDASTLKLLDACNTVAAAMGFRLTLTIPWTWYLPTSENRRLDEALRCVNDFASRFIADRQRAIRSGDSQTSGSLLDNFIAASEASDAHALTSEELLNSVGGLFFAAYDTTSESLLMLLNYLARYPSVQETLRAELARAFPRGRADLEGAAMADLERVEYLTYVIDEVNRLHAFAPFFGRLAAVDVELAGHIVAKGTDVLIDSNSLGKVPELWGGQTDLEVFRPERWAEVKPPAVTQMAFGFGPRVCPGRKLALAEMKAFVAAVLLSGCDVRLRAPGKALEVDMRLGLGVREGSGDISFVPRAA